jgi:hypothetical protein
VSEVFGGLDLCSCKRGFFTLRDCANPAAATCSACSRRICSEHLAPSGICKECAAKRDEDEDLGAVGYRTQWYQRRSYAPVWWGTSDPYYYDTSYRWYDDDQDDDGGGFSDS